MLNRDVNRAIRSEFTLVLGPLNIIIKINWVMIFTVTLQTAWICFIDSLEFINPALSNTSTLTSVREGQVKIRIDILTYRPLSSKFSQNYNM